MKKLFLLFSLMSIFSVLVPAQCPTSIEEDAGDGSSYLLHLANSTECSNYPLMNTITINGEPFIIQSCLTTPGIGTWVQLTQNGNPVLISAAPIVFSVGALTCTYNNMGVLPIELSSFEGKALEKSNLLTWQTKSESQNNGFNIERSTDGNRFEKIGFVAGKGTTSQMQRYTFEDSFPSGEGRDGAGYYRLKQLDFDGRFEYSKIISITQKGGNTVSVYPNPTEGILNISATDYEQTFVLVNSIGQVVKQGEQLEATINLQSLPSGFYYLKIGAQTMKVALENGF
jgi:Secretion system C-terminal sorting domain